MVSISQSWTSAAPAILYSFSLAFLPVATALWGWTDFRENYEVFHGTAGPTRCFLIMQNNRDSTRCGTKSIISSIKLSVMRRNTNCEHMLVSLQFKSLYLASCTSIAIMEFLHAFLVCCTFAFFYFYFFLENDAMWSTAKLTDMALLQSASWWCCLCCGGSSSGDLLNCWVHLYLL